MHDETRFEIKTEIRRHGEWPTRLVFRVSCTGQASTPVQEMGEGEEAEIASLEGFIYDAGCYPEVDEIDEDAFLDGSEGHAHKAFGVIAEDRSSVAVALGTTVDELETLKDRFIYLIRAEVSDGFRGHGLALRLMREARAVLSSYGTMAILKAFPDGDEVTDEAQLRLAAYYQSDATSGFKIVSAEKHKGLMVACWDDNYLLAADAASWSPTGR